MVVEIVHPFFIFSKKVAKKKKVSCKYSCDMHEDICENIYIYIYFINMNTSEHEHFYMNERMYIYEFFINNKREREKITQKRIIQLLRVIEVVFVFVVTAIVII